MNEPFHHEPVDRALVRAIDRLTAEIAELRIEVAHMSVELTRLTQEVAETQGAVQSAIALLEGLSQFIRDHVDDPAALNQLADNLDAQQAAIAAAVAANPIPPTP